MHGAAARLLGRLRGFGAFRRCRGTGESSVVDGGLSRCLASLLGREGLAGTRIVHGTRLDSNCTCRVFSNLGATPGESGLVYLSVKVNLSMGRAGDILGVTKLSPLCPGVGHSDVVVVGVGGGGDIMRVGRTLCGRKRSALGWR